MMTTIDFIIQVFDIAEMRYHVLKTWPPYFRQTQLGQKTFELRKNDRDYKEGDLLILREYMPDNGYTGRLCIFKAGTIIKEEWGLDEDVCVISLLPFNFFLTKERRNQND